MVSPELVWDGVTGIGVGWCHWNCCGMVSLELLWDGVTGIGVGWCHRNCCGMVSQEFFIDITLPIALWPWG